MESQGKPEHSLLELRPHLNELKRRDAMHI